MADISSITLPNNGGTYNFKDSVARANGKVSGVKGNSESTYRTGNVNITAANIGAYAIPQYGTGTTDISIRSMVAYARANRFAFLPADQVIIEETTDGGTTWISGNYSDDQKKALFATRGASIKIPLLNGAKSTQCGIRITFTAMKYNVPSGTAETNKYQYWNSNYILSAERYSNLREMWFWLSANNDTIRVYAYAATGIKPNEWNTYFNTDFGLTGWSGSDWIRWSSAPTFGGGTTQTGNFWNWRLEFWSRIPDGKTAFQSASQQVINGIAGYGDSVWTTPNGLMKEDHLYTWDANKNASFPAHVTATQFNGPLNGNASSATNASKVNNHTVNADVPSDAVFTDTTYQSKTAASGGTDVSLVTTGEKYTWNAKTNTRVKGDAEGSYRTGDVNLTPANIGALAVTATMTSAEVLAAVQSGWNGTS